MNGLFGSNKPNYYINTNKGLAASSINNQNAGGIGNYGYVKSAEGNYYGVDENAYNAMKNANTSDLYTSSQMNDVLKNNTGNGLFGGLSSFGGALQGLGALANAYTGYKNYQLANDQFGFEKALAQTNLANQADLINEQRSKASDVGLALAGSSMSDADKQAARDKITAANVKGTI